MDQGGLFKFKKLHFGFREPGTLCGFDENTKGNLGLPVKTESPAFPWRQMWFQTLKDLTS